jgi:hypothetical protein
MFDIAPYTGECDIKTANQLELSQVRYSLSGGLNRIVGYFRYYFMAKCI